MKGEESRRPRPHRVCVPVRANTTDTARTLTRTAECATRYWTPCSGAADESLCAKLPAMGAIGSGSISIRSCSPRDRSSLQACALIL